MSLYLIHPLVGAHLGIPPIAPDLVAVSWLYVAAVAAATDRCSFGGPFLVRSTNYRALATALKDVNG